MTSRRVGSLAIAISGALLAASLNADAQQPARHLSGPVLGYVWSETGLHPLQGVPGSATIGQPVDLGFEIAHVLAPGGRHLLVSAVGMPGLLSADVSAHPPSIEPVRELSFTPAVSVASRSGSAAALYDAGAQRIVILAGLPAHARISRSVDVLPAGLAVTHMAVSDDGAVLVYAVSSDLHASLYSWTAASGTRFLVDTDAVGALALVGDGVVVANPRGHEVFLVRDLAGAGRWQLLAGSGRSVSSPVGVAVSGGDRVHVANAGSGAVMTFDLTGRLLSTRHCSCEISGLYPVRESIYRLTARVDRTMFLFDARSGSPAVLFVPPVGTGE